MDIRVLLLLLPGLMALFTQRGVASAFRRYDAVPNRAGVSGEWVAWRLLAEHGLTSVSVRRVEGTLSDHYDTAAAVLRLSAPVADRSSVAALAVAAHEVGHAVQEAQGFGFNRVRRRVGRVVARLSPFAAFFFLGGFLLGLLPLIVAGSAVLVLMAVFALATLPVEADASRRAVAALRRTGVAAPDEVTGVRAVLRAAALTYVAKLGWRLGMVLFLVAGLVSALQVA